MPEVRDTKTPSGTPLRVGGSVIGPPLRSGYEHHISETRHGGRDTARENSPRGADEEYRTGSGGTRRVRGQPSPTRVATAASNSRTRQYRLPSGRRRHSATSSAGVTASVLGDLTTQYGGMDREQSHRALTGLRRNSVSMENREHVLLLYKEYKRRFKSRFQSQREERAARLHLLTVTGDQALVMLGTLQLILHLTTGASNGVTGVGFAHICLSALVFILAILGCSLAHLLGNQLLVFYLLLGIGTFNAVYLPTAAWTQRGNFQELCALHIVIIYCLTGHSFLVTNVLATVWAVAFLVSYKATESQREALLGYYRQSAGALSDAMLTSQVLKMSAWPKVLTRIFTTAGFLFVGDSKLLGVNVGEASMNGLTKTHRTLATDDVMSASPLEALETPIGFADCGKSGTEECHRRSSHYSASRPPLHASLPPSLAYLDDQASDLSAFDDYVAAGVDWEPGYLAYVSGGPHPPARELISQRQPVRQLIEDPKLQSQNLISQVKELSESVDLISQKFDAAVLNHDLLPHEDTTQGSYATSTRGAPAGVIDGVSPSDTKLRGGYMTRRLQAATSASVTATEDESATAQPVTAEATETNNPASGKEVVLLTADEYRWIVGFPNGWDLWWSLCFWGYAFVLHHVVFIEAFFILQSRRSSLFAIGEFSALLQMEAVVYGFAQKELSTMNDTIQELSHTAILTRRSSTAGASRPSIFRAVLDPQGTAGVATTCGRPMVYGRLSGGGTGGVAPNDGWTRCALGYRHSPTHRSTARGPATLGFSSGTRRASAPRSSPIWNPARLGADPDPTEPNNPFAALMIDSLARALSPASEQDSQSRNSEMSKPVVESPTPGVGNSSHRRRRLTSAVTHFFVSRGSPSGATGLMLGRPDMTTTPPVEGGDSMDHFQPTTPKSQPVGLVGDFVQVSSACAKGYRRTTEDTAGEGGTGGASRTHSSAGAGCRSSRCIRLRGRGERRNDGKGGGATKPPSAPPSTAGRAISSETGSPTKSTSPPRTHDEYTDSCNRRTSGSVMLSASRKRRHRSDTSPVWVTPSRGGPFTAVPNESPDIWIEGRCTRLRRRVRRVCYCRSCRRTQTSETLSSRFKPHHQYGFFACPDDLSVSVSRESGTTVKAAIPGNVLGSAAAGCSNGSNRGTGNEASLHYYSDHRYGSRSRRSRSSGYLDDESGSLFSGPDDVDAWILSNSQPTSSAAVTTLLRPIPRRYRRVPGRCSMWLSRWRRRVICGVTSIVNFVHGICLSRDITIFPVSCPVKKSPPFPAQHLAGNFTNPHFELWYTEWLQAQAPKSNCYMQKPFLLCTALQTIHLITEAVIFCKRAIPCLRVKAAGWSPIANGESGDYNGDILIEADKLATFDDAMVRQVIIFAAVCRVCLNVGLNLLVINPTAEASDLRRGRRLQIRALQLAGIQIVGAIFDVALQAAVAARFTTSSWRGLPSTVFGALILLPIYGVTLRLSPLILLACVSMVACGVIVLFVFPTPSGVFERLTCQICYSLVAVGCVARAIDKRRRQIFVQSVLPYLIYLEALQDWVRGVHACYGSEAYKGGLLTRHLLGGHNGDGEGGATGARRSPRASHSGSEGSYSDADGDSHFERPTWVPPLKENIAKLRNQNPEALLSPALPMSGGLHRGSIGSMDVILPPPVKRKQNGASGTISAPEAIGFNPPEHQLATKGSIKKSNAPPGDWWEVQSSIESLGDQPRCEPDNGIASNESVMGTDGRGVYQLLRRAESPSIAVMPARNNLPIAQRQATKECSSSPLDSSGGSPTSAEKNLSVLRATAALNFFQCCRDSAISAEPDNELAVATPGEPSSISIAALSHLASRAATLHHLTKSSPPLRSSPSAMLQYTFPPRRMKIQEGHNGIPAIESPYIFRSLNNDNLASPSHLRARRLSLSRASLQLESRPVLPLESSPPSLGFVTSIPHNLNTLTSQLPAFQSSLGHKVSTSTVPRDSSDQFVGSPSPIFDHLIPLGKHPEGAARRSS